MLKNRALPLLILLAVTVVFPASLRAQELTNALTADEVGCNEAQLENLLERLHLTGGGTNNLIVTYNEHSFYEGLAVARPDDHQASRSEYYLAFHLNPDVRDLLLNPVRSPLGEVSLTREKPASNLVPPSSPFALVLRLNPLAGPPPQPPWTFPGLLVINNFEESGLGASYNGFLAASVQPGRGLEQDGLLSPCHDKLTRFDRRIFAILQRLVVAGALTYVGGSDFFDFDMKVAIFRDQDPHTFRIYVYPAGGLVKGRRLAVRLRIDWTPDGRLTTGSLKVLPACTEPGQSSCTQSPGADETYLTLAPPIFGGREMRQFGPPAASAIYSTLGTPIATGAEVDFGLILAGTAWNEAFAASTSIRPVP